jgi:hypothetical protein
MHHHTQPDPLATESFPTDPSGLPEAGDGVGASGPAWRSVADPSESWDHHLGGLSSAAS